ncbi:MAG: T9SS type A sorting domain-containing protein [Ignavibacteriae bacterium]|nr:T9SS type A sorting domain-containing protein [Ignavibacteriota bacterium]
MITMFNLIKSFAHVFLSVSILFLCFGFSLNGQVHKSKNGKSPWLGNTSMTEPAQLHQEKSDKLMREFQPATGKTATIKEGLSGERAFSSASFSTPYIWDEQFGTNGFNDDVETILKFGNEIYVGGLFTLAGGKTVNRIARWDGTQWDSLGGGVNFIVWALAKIGTDLYVGGQFTSAGGITVNGIAKWDGSSWSALGSGVAGAVYALAVNGTDLYVGGSFTTAGGIPANGIAKWDGTNWSALGSGMDMAVFTLAFGGGTLYAGGPFTNAGGTSVNYIARWNGTNWSALGTGVSGWVQTLLANNSTLYVGGDFGQAGGIYSPGIAKWNGTVWSAMGSGINSTVRSLSLRGSKLYAGGYALYIWDGTAWATNGNSPNGLILSLSAEVNDTIYAGGTFTSTVNTASLRFGRCYPAGKALAIEEGRKWNFPPTKITESYSYTMKIYNTGVGENLSISSVTSSLPDFTSSPTSASIAPGDSFTFQIIFSPLSEGIISATITFTHDAFNSPSSVGVTGIGLPAPPPIPPKYYRTARYEDWATSVDAAGKRKAAKRKYDKVFFKFNIVADSVRPLKMDFGMLVNATVTRGKSKTETLAVVTNLKKLTDSLLSVSTGETLQVDGIGKMGKKIVVKYQWGKKKAVALNGDQYYKLNLPGLPMPNLVNVGEELFPKGFGNPGTPLPSGILIGRPGGTKNPNTVLLKKYADVLKSFVKVIKNGIRLHSDSLNARCLDSIDGTKKKAISSQLAALPPDKQDNKLFAEAVTLKLNIGASVSEKFPAGLGQLKYINPDDSTNPFNGKFVSTIPDIADYYLSCQTLEGFPAVTFQELYDILRSINVAFADSPYTIDTLSFGSKTKFTGLKKIEEVNYLQETPGVEPKIFSSVENVDNVPEQIALHQNYPNPFNPSTVIRYQLSVNSFVTLKVFDMLGREVATLANSEQYEAGNYELEFDASNLASGLYFYRITVAGQDGILSYTDSKKMTLIK